MHFQGLMTLNAIDGRQTMMLNGIAGACLEGIFLLSLMILLLKKRCWWANVAVCLLGVVSINSLLSMETFMRKIGDPSLPSMFIVIAGLREARAHLKGEATNDMKGLITGLIEAYSLALPAAIVVWREAKRKDYDEDSYSTSRTSTIMKKRQHVLFFFGLFVALATTYYLDSWLPIFHVYASACGSLIFSPPLSGSTKILQERGRLKKEAAPNLVLLIHESLSGEYTMTREEAVKLMPFLQMKFQSNDEEFFVFENMRTVSGDTVDCVPAIVSGCLPLHEKGLKSAYSTNMATEAKKRGYQTVSFSSRAFTMKGTKWFMIQDALSINFDQIWEPGRTGDPLINDGGQDDRLMGKNFKNWLDVQKQSNETTKTPFFAQLYYFDAHYPYNRGDSNLTVRIDAMHETVDAGIKDIFSYLEDAGELDNTVVIVSGDHGEIIKQVKPYGRLRFWNDNVLHPLTFAYVPKQISTQNPGIVSNLRHNRLALVSTLDLFPTMMHVLDGISSTKTSVVTDNDCIMGYDLLSQKIDSERLAWSFSAAHTFAAGSRPSGNFGIHYKGSSLVNHFGWPHGNGVKIITYNQTVGSYGEKNDDENLRTLLDWKIFMQNQEEGIGKNHSTPHHLAPLMMNSTYMNMTMLLDEIGKAISMNTLMRTLNFCQSCHWRGSVTCNERKDYLIGKYRVSPLEAIEGAMKEKSTHPHYPSQQTLLSISLSTSEMNPTRPDPPCNQQKDGDAVTMAKKKSKTKRIH
eukprot:scaffold111_cov142-Skeletonema_menzelii.AAC.25